MKLSADTITTREVLDWQGLHLLNFSQSSCSQKVRILLAEKGVRYRSREVNLARGEQTTGWFLGINPRGVVPVLVHDGEVHVESNDILRYIEEKFPSDQHSWFPNDAWQRDLTDRLLELEDELHIHLRVATMGYLLPHSVAKKSEAELEAYAKNGADDPDRDQIVAWWRAYGDQGITDRQADEAVEAFDRAFSELNLLIEDRQWLLGDEPSVLDIAWFITLYRTVEAGYPIRVHPALEELYERMLARPAFRQELTKGPRWVQVVGRLYRRFRRLRGTSLESVYQRWSRRMNTLDTPKGKLPS